MRQSSGLIRGIMLAAIVGAAAFRGGQYYQVYETRPVTIANGCSHYDPRTGEFTWGAFVGAANASDLSSGAAETLKQAAHPSPKRKPAPPEHIMMGE